MKVLALTSALLPTLLLLPTSLSFTPSLPTATATSPRLHLTGNPNAFSSQLSSTDLSGSNSKAEMVKDVQRGGEEKGTSTAQTASYFALW